MSENVTPAPVPRPAPTPVPTAQHEHEHNPPSQPASPIAKRTKVLVDDDGGTATLAGVATPTPMPMATPTPLPSSGTVIGTADPRNSGETKKN